MSGVSAEAPKTASQPSHSFIVSSESLHSQIPKSESPRTFIPKPAPPHNHQPKIRASESLKPDLLKPPTITQKSKDRFSAARSRISTNALKNIRKNAKATGENRKTSNPVNDTQIEHIDVNMFAGSRTTKRHREELPTDWPSKPNLREQYEWFTTGDGSTVDIPSSEGIFLYVPVSAAVGLFTERAVIVGSRFGDGPIFVDYEDTRYSSLLFADLVERAYGRLISKGPTFARMILDASLLTKVGSYDPELGILSIHDSVAFSNWSGIGSVELHTSDGLPARRRQWATFLQERPDVALVPALQRLYAPHFNLDV